MARTAKPWFRFYVDAVRDPKMRRLTPAQRWLWVAVLAAARHSSKPGVLMLTDTLPMHEGDLAEWAGIPTKEAAAGLALMLELRMLAHDEEHDAWCVPRFLERQYESDNSTVRTRKHRSKTVPTCAVGTPPETEAETETDTEPGNPLQQQQACRGSAVAALQEAALNLLVDRRLLAAELKGTRIASPGGYRRVVLAELRSQHASLLTDSPDVDLTSAESWADWLEPYGVAPTHTVAVGRYTSIPPLPDCPTCSNLRWLEADGDTYARCPDCNRGAA